MMDSFSLKHRGHYFIRAILLCCLAFYIMGLNNSDALHYYLAPHMQRLLLLCPIPLLFIAFGMLWHAMMGDSAQICDCEHPLPGGLLKSTGVYGMFAIPLLFGLLLPDQALGSDMAAKKGMVYSFPDPELEHKAKPTASLVPALSTLDEMFIPRDIYSVEFSELAKRLYPLPVIQVDPLIFSETIGAIDMYKEHFADKKIVLQGFVFREEDMPPDSFALTRFLVMCCTADAVPFGVLARGDEVSALEEDAWIELEGTIGVGNVNGEERLQITVDQIRSVEQPASPYIFTHPDSVAAFDAKN
ncbi:TIGR03943 family putative permease subunit [Paenibacillus antibioticophila]|uniref:TIGR03943 family putative permease subunit n=1 Tax=Paenibacillus antibioticophila TaxID=1274374 RepID=UPI0005CA7D8B|nr:TIGR03943 family protein [Paenibacillus antibioticophila]